MPGAFSPIIIIYWYKRIASGNSALSWEKFMAGLSCKWNGEDDRRGRQVWHNCLDRGIKSHGHFWASVNYIHHNPVHHGCVEKWQGWPWSSAEHYIERVGHETAAKIWHKYPILDYGKKWDVD
jgi:putative transposase